MFELKIDPTNSFDAMTVIEFSERCGNILHLLKQAHEAGMSLRTALKPVFGENPERVEGVIADNGSFIKFGDVSDAAMVIAVVTVDDEVCRIYKDFIAITAPGLNDYVVVT